MTSPLTPNRLAAFAVRWWAIALTSAVLALLLLAGAVIGWLLR